MSYSAACALALLLGWGGAATAKFIGAWRMMPVMAAVGLMLGPVINDQTLSCQRRLAYRLFFYALVLDCIASIGWRGPGSMA